MSDKELIKQEIEKYTKEEALKSNGSEFYGGRVSMCTKILSFIDSLPEEHASENKSEKELAEAYLAVFDRKYPILPTLKGKQKADFKNFLNKCQQEFGLKEFGIHPTQAKLFEKLTLLWATWGAEHLEGLGKSNQDEFDKMSASEDLDFQTFAKEMDAVFALPSSETENTEENPLNWEYAIARHFAEWQKQQMMKDAVEAEVMYPASSSTLQIRYKLPKNTELKYGDKVKIIIVKTEQQ